MSDEFHPVQFPSELMRQAALVVETLKANKLRLVLAESCTAGLVAGTLSQIAGVSEYLCGSAVTYRNLTKAEWLHVSQADLDHPDIGAVSEQVAGQMVIGALAQTPEANLAAAVTGHLGPNAPSHQDGLIYVGTMFRSQSPIVVAHRLGPMATDPLQSRYARQTMAIQIVLEAIIRAAQSHP